MPLLVLRTQRTIEGSRPQQKQQKRPQQKQQKNKNNNDDDYNNKKKIMGKHKNQPMQLSPAQRDLVERLKTNPDTGLTTDEVTARRETSGQFNVVKPPIDCPPTVCCLLPCIKHFPSMKAFRAIEPEDAEVLRGGTWIRYDVTSLVQGDIIRMEEGDVVPADCVVLDLTTSMDCQELLVDVRGITAEEKPRSAKRVARKTTNMTDSNNSSNNVEEVMVVQPVQLYWGGTVVQGGCIAVVSFKLVADLFFYFLLSSLETRDLQLSHLQNCYSREIDRLFFSFSCELICFALLQKIK